MASHLHIDQSFYSGSLQKPPPFESKSRLILSDDGVGILLQIGDEDASPEEIPALTLGADGARKLIEGLTTALGNIGELE